jgi:hypothetical protein
MRTERTTWPNLPFVALLIGAAVIAGAFAIRSGVMSEAGETPQTLPPDIVALGTSVTPLDPQGTISREQALMIAKDQMGPQFEDATTEPFLVSVADPTIPALNDRGVWLVKVSDISIPVSGGVRPGMPLDRRATLAYVYIDAFTGEWITTAMRVHTYE